MARVLYAYTHPKKMSCLYIGKADRLTPNMRLTGPHKARIFEKIVTDHKVASVFCIVGEIALEEGRRLSKELLSDIETLLINQIQPQYNVQARCHRISRPGMVVRCTGEWAYPVSRFLDA